MYINKRRGWGERQFLNCSLKIALSWWNFYFKNSPKSISPRQQGEEGGQGGQHFPWSAVFHCLPLFPSFSISRLQIASGVWKKPDPMAGHLWVLEWAVKVLAGKAKTHSHCPFPHCLPAEWEQGSHISLAYQRLRGAYQAALFRG